jgi:peptidoglycan/LPS O-acetylase OafA/YrhL
VALMPGIPPLLLVAATSCIVTALGLLLNICVERPSLKLARRLDLSGWPAVKPAAELPVAGADSAAQLDAG